MLTQHVSFLLYYIENVFALTLIFKGIKGVYRWLRISTKIWKYPICRYYLDWLYCKILDNYNVPISEKKLKTPHFVVILGEINGIKGNQKSKIRLEHFFSPTHVLSFKFEKILMCGLDITYGWMWFLRALFFSAKRRENKKQAAVARFRWFVKLEE